MSRELTYKEIDTITRYYRHALQDIVTKEEDFQRLVESAINFCNQRFKWINALENEPSTKNINNYYREFNALLSNLIKLCKEIGVTEEQAGKILIAAFIPTTHIIPNEKKIQTTLGKVLLKAMWTNILDSSFLDSQKLIEDLTEIIQEEKRLVILGSDFKPTETLLGRTLKIKPQELEAVFRKELENAHEAGTKEALYNKIRVKHKFGFFCRLKSFAPKGCDRNKVHKFSQ